VLELWATYDCEFFVPDITEAFGSAPDRAALQRPAAVAPSGTLLAADPMNLGIGMSVKGDSSQWAQGITPNIPGLFWGTWSGSDHIGVLNRYGMDDVDAFSYMFSMSSTVAGDFDSLVGTNLSIGGTNVVAAARFPWMTNSTLVGGSTQAVFAGNVSVTTPGIPHDMKPPSAATINILNEDQTVDVIVCDGNQVFSANFEALFTSGATITGLTGNISSWLVLAINGYGSQQSTLLTRSAGPQTLEGYARRKFEELPMDDREEYGDLASFYSFLHDKLHPRRDPQLPDIEDIVSRHRHPSGKEDVKEHKDGASMELASLRVSSTPPPTPNSMRSVELVEVKTTPAPTPQGAIKPLVKKGSTK